jgi:hypothetical protein
MKRSNIVKRSQKGSTVLTIAIVGVGVLVFLPVGMSLMELVNSHPVAQQR